MDLQIMMGDLTSISVSNLNMCSYNMYGFSNGAHTAKSLCLNHDIVMLQEHWLSNNNLNKLNTIHNDFSVVGVSSMESKIESGLLCGRPFGGTAIMWNRSLGSCIKILEKDDNNGKYVCIRLSDDAIDIIITCVYLPYFRQNNDYIVETSLILAHIESILDKYPECSHIVGETSIFSVCLRVKGSPCLRTYY